MTIEKQKIPESRVSDAPERMKKAWMKIVNSDQDSIYKKMSEKDLRELREKIKRGEPPEKGMEHIVEYLSALDDYLSRGNT